MFKPSIDDLIKSALRSIWKNKGRTILTSLGIIIGVTSVILLTSIGNGLKNYINSQFESLGSNVIFVSPGKIFNDKGGFNNSQSGFVITTSFDLKDISNIKRQIKDVDISPVVETSAKLKRGNVTKDNVTIVGSNYLYGKGSNSIPKPGFGRWFTPEEDDKKNKVAVIGYNISQELYPNLKPLGRKIKLLNSDFEIIGIVEKKGSSFGGPSLDDAVYIPINTTFSLLGNQKVQSIYVKAHDQNKVEDIKKELKQLLLNRYDKDAFSVYDSSQLLSSINSIIGTLTIALTGIAAISLVVGGIGIMNIMLVTVTERTREIGLRKAIGAYPRAILLQFLFEAVILSGIGGLFGIILGTLGTLAINNFFPAKVTLDSILLAFGVSSLVGIIFGVAPARKASQLSPIEALRYE